MSDPADSAESTSEPVDGAGDAADAAESTDASEPNHAVVLDVLPNGRLDDDRPQYQKSPVAYVIGESAFTLYELSLNDDADLSVGDRIPIDGGANLATRYREIDYDDVTRNANAELEYAVEAIVDENERRFVDFYNEANPITLRLHQLNLLPGIGKKLRNNILDERKRGPFESFEDLEDRISGLHSPKDIVVERIIEELRDDDLKYKTFVGRHEE